MEILSDFYGTLERESNATWRFMKTLKMRELPQKYLQNFPKKFELVDGKLGIKLGYSNLSVRLKWSFRGPSKEASSANPTPHSAS